MSYLDILVHVDDSDACPARLETAIALAERHGAVLHGYCIAVPENLAMYGEAALAADLIEAALQSVEDNLIKAEASFREAVSGTKLETTCKATKGHPAYVLADAARGVDLTIVGQPDADDPGCTSEGVAASVVFGGGSAVLVHPRRGQFPAVGKHVVVAWNGSREAQRAVSEALPLLRSAERVDVVSVIPEKLPSGDGHGSTQNICERLSRRGIEAYAHHVVAADDDAGDTLLARSAELGADVLVLGAYGHSRLREFLLGGVTRRVLQVHEIPLLLAH